MSATAGDTILLPIELVDPAGYGVVSAEVQLNWSSAAADFLGVVSTGTIAEAAGWSAPTIATSLGQVVAVTAGVSPLSGAGVLLYLRMVVRSSFTVSVSPGIFNESMPGYPENGYVSVTALPTLYISPPSVNLLVGDVQAFVVSGGATPPLTWSVDDPTVATIDGSGGLTAIAEGVVRVFVQDSLSAQAFSGAVSVCSFALPPLGVSVAAPDTVLIPVTVDRIVTALDIYSYEIGVSYNPAQVEFLGAESTGTISQSWGTPVVMDFGGTLRVVHAGGVPLVECGPALVYLRFRGVSGTYVPSLSSALFNEGAPCARINTRTACSYGTDAPALGLGMRLWPNQPNPFNPITRIRFEVARSGLVDLAVYSSRGELVRRLAQRSYAVGRVHEVYWDGRTDDGRTAPSGVYFARLAQSGEVRIEKMTLLK
jgi:Bacterial Ig-like domain (group 2)